MVDPKILEKAIRHFGHKAQLRKAAEECLELALAITHYLDGRDNAEEVAEECADVLITAPQVRLIIGDKFVDGFTAEKLARLEERMGG